VYEIRDLAGIRRGSEEDLLGGDGVQGWP